MKKLVALISVIVLVIYCVSCNGGNTNSSTDTANVPAIGDTMPVLHPQSKDSSSTITTPPTNDSMAIMPDSAIKNK